MTTYFITEHHNLSKGLPEWFEMPLKATICINLVIADYKYGEIFLDGSILPIDLDYDP